VEATRGKFLKELRGLPDIDMDLGLGGSGMGLSPAMPTYLMRCYGKGSQGTIMKTGSVIQNRSFRGQTVPLTTRMAAGVKTDQFGIDDPMNCEKGDHSIARFLNCRRKQTEGNLFLLIQGGKSK
jgi:hypothetical protein